MSSPEDRHGTKRPASPSEVSEIIKTELSPCMKAVNYSDKVSVALACLLTFGFKSVIVKSEHVCVCSPDKVYSPSLG